MKIRCHLSRAVTRALLLSGSPLVLWTTALAQGVPGLPEPGLILYGPVNNLNGDHPVVSSPTVWQVSGGGSSATVSSTVAIVNGQYFHIARIPFETRSISGQNLTPNANTLPLATGITFSRSATVSGEPAMMVSSSRGMLNTFTFTAADRGLLERVNLTVNLPGITYEDWLALYPSLPTHLRGPNDDPDGDGMTNDEEFRAGTDPTRADSYFGFVEIVPHPVTGVVLRWSSVGGKTYAVERAEELGGDFVILQAGIAATPELNMLHDATATGLGPYFYRLTVE